MDSICYHYANYVQSYQMHIGLKTVHANYIYARFVPTFSQSLSKLAQKGHLAPAKSFSKGRALHVSCKFLQKMRKLLLAKTCAFQLKAASGLLQSIFVQLVIQTAHSDAQSFGRFGLVAFGLL